MIKLMAVDVYRAIMAHVNEGGILGAGWPHYVIEGKVTQFQLDAGYEMAVRDGALDLSEDNFRDACRATFEA